MKNYYHKLFPLSLFVFFFSCLLFFFPPPALATTIVIDPGHSGCNPSSICLDKSHGFLDQDSNNGDENQEVIDVANDLQGRLQKAGYNVIMTKTSALENITLWDRANKANQAHADLAISIHDDHKKDWTWAEIYEQTMSSYRTNSDGSRYNFKNQAVADKSHNYAKNVFEPERQKAEGNGAHVTVNSGFGGRGLSAGNIPWVQLLANVPWVYNEVGAKGGLDAAKKKKYADGLYNSIIKAVPSNGAAGASGGGNTTSCVITKVGNPKNPPPPLPPECTSGTGNSTGTGVSGQCGAVVDWGQKINDGLQIGSNGLYSVLGKQLNSCGATTSSGKYWCTYSIVDAYNLAGLKGLSVSQHAAVVTMRQWWKSAGGYKYIDGSAPKGVGPGYAVFLETSAGQYTGHEHVFMVKSITVDSRGNGTLVSLESNSSKQSKNYPISGWNIANTAYPVRGFGGH